MAYKQQEHDYKRLERNLAQNIFDNIKVVVLYGHEDYLVKSYEKKIQNLFIQPAAANLDYTRLDGENVAVDTIISHLETLPMLSAKRVVTIENYPALKPSGRSADTSTGDGDYFKEADIKKLIEYIKDIPETAVLVFISDQIDTRKSLSKALKNEGEIYNFDKLDRKDIGAFIKKRFRIEEKVADDSIIKEIINTSGYFDRDSEYNLNNVVNDIIKISSFSKDNVITSADVSNVMSTSLETDAFALLDSLSSGNKGDAMLLINNIMGTGESGFKLLGLIISQFELMLGIKEYSVRDMNKSQIMNELGIKSEFRYKKVSQYLSNYSVDKLEDILKSLYSVEKNIKTGIYNEKLAMTMFVATI